MSDNLTVIGNQLIFAGRKYRCAVGKAGFSADKREGDHKTPLGIFPLRECLYRADRISMPDTKLQKVAIREDDGWCDDPKSPAYNRPVKRPYDFSHEALFRADHMYDLIVPIGYNDDPVVAGKGSAIFMHIAHDNYEPTEGCVALAKDDLLALLPQLSTATQIEIRER